MILLGPLLSTLKDLSTRQSSIQTNIHPYNMTLLGLILSILKNLAKEQPSIQQTSIHSTWSLQDSYWVYWELSKQSFVHPTNIHPFNMILLGLILSILKNLVANIHLSKTNIHPFNMILLGHHIEYIEKLINQTSIHPNKHDPSRTHIEYIET